MSEFLSIERAVNAPMPLPPGWTTRPEPHGRFCATAPYPAHAVEADSLDQTVIADTQEDLARQAWNQYHRYEVAVHGCH